MDPRRLTLALAAPSSALVIAAALVVPCTSVEPRDEALPRVFGACLAGRSDAYTDAPLVDVRRLEDVHARLAPESSDRAAIVALVSIGPPPPPGEPATEPARVPPRLPSLAGLLLDPSADDVRLGAWYARATDEDLVRARFRLERLLDVAAQGADAWSELGLALCDGPTVVRERDHVAERIARFAAPVGTLAGLASTPCDENADYSARYASHDVEDLAVAAWRVSRAEQELVRAATELAFACGDYTVTTSSAGWG